MIKPDYAYRAEKRLDLLSEILAWIGIACVAVTFYLLGQLV